ncbi:sigma-70 family RNA polymerase sigma factor [Saccharopolyspora griseoalba]|uniref:Sigma-70 family RNA polymerase sigma factor n=1 Tax=Saccharopolyspora griseoalba TaxID=1431848 RepID=A0ABW2LR59_9PSEU
MTLAGHPRPAVAARRAGAAHDGERALRALYQEYYLRLLAYTNRILSDPHHAEDIVQETMLRAWQHADALTPDRGSVWGWLTRVAHNIAIDRIRARRARPVEVDESAGTAVAVEHADHAEAVLNRVAIRAMVDRLNPAHRSVVHEVYYNDRTAKRAATALGIPPGTVKSRLHHALRNLRATAEHHP